MGSTHGNLDLKLTDDEYDDLMRLAKRRSNEFLADLESKVKRYQPDYFIPELIGIMRGYHRQKLYARAPRHWIGLTLEANCAYARDYHCDQLTRNAYARIHNVFNDQEQPELKSLIKQDWGHFFLLMHRQQIELQKDYSYLEVVRYYRLFMRNAPLQASSQVFEDKYGISISDWIKSSFLIFTAARSNPKGLVRAVVEDTRIDVANEAVETYVEQASLDPRQIGLRFKNLREKTSVQYHTCIRSVFLDYPLIDLGRSEYAAPFSGLVFHHGATGVHRRLQECPEFREEFGRSMESYVELLGRCLRDVIVVVSEADMAKRSKCKTCDMLIEYDDHILLLESKAVIFSRDIIAPSTIPNDNSTLKIQRALVQLYETANSVKSGLYTDLNVSSSKPIFGVVVTFGEVPFANAPWYYERYLLNEAWSKLSKDIVTNPPISHTPIIVSLEGIEKLVILQNATKQRVPRLCDDKETKGYGTTGDWDTHLGNLLRDVDSPLQYLPHVKEDHSQFFAGLGVNK